MNDIATITLSLLAASSFAQVDAEEIRVRATAWVGVIPDRASVSVWFEFKGESRQSAEALLSENRDSYIDSLRTWGISSDDIDDSHFRFLEHYPELDKRSKWARQDPPVVRVQQRVRIHTNDFGRLDDIARAAFHFGAVPRGGVRIQFISTDTSDAHRRGFEAALSKALDEAEVIAKNSGVKLGSLTECKSHTSVSDRSIIWEDFGFPTHVAPYEMKYYVTVVGRWTIEKEPTN